jgi:hypothetical protein
MDRDAAYIVATHFDLARVEACAKRAVLTTSAYALRRNSSAKSESQTFLVSTMPPTHKATSASARSCGRGSVRLSSKTFTMPDQSVMFVGDFIMPYLGAPFVREGDLQGLLDAIDVVVQTNPRYLLHGHEPLTRNFASAAMLAQLKTDLAWLRDQVLGAIRRGDERGAVHQANLIPPGLFNDQPDVYQPYLIMREHVIDRLYDDNVGYWLPNLQGVEHLTRADQAELLVDYLGVSESQLVKTVERLTADGRYELAASLLESSGDKFASSAPVANAKRFVYLKLMEKHQNTDPFKFIIYSAKAGEQAPQIAAPK